VALEVDEFASEADRSTEQADLTPFTGAESYWVPTRVVVSAWLEHAPFASWLMSVVRPSTFVELGTHNGFSFFTFCEAAVRLGLETRSWALDTWEGDDHAGFYTDEVYDDVEAVRRAHYPDSATLLRGYFADSVGSFADHSIDLLHIDGRHGYEDVKDDFESWLPKVSDRGIVLFHDIAERERGFGVWRLWEQLRMQYPSFTFQHGHGLGVLSVGAEIPMRLRPLFDASEAAERAIREFYVAQGQVVHARWVKDLEIAALQERVREVEGERDASRAEILAMAGSYSWRLTRPIRRVAESMPASARSSVRASWDRVRGAIRR
jgi:predicted O-methyltransferase YrrM